MCNNNVTNPWGLQEVKSATCPAFSCCPCVFKTGKVVDISAVSKQSTPVVAVTLPPEALVKSALGSPVHDIDSRLSPRENGRTHAPQPPPSSGSESSGYFTPPPETEQAFVKLDTEEHASESEEIAPENDDNNNSQDCTDSFNNNSPNIFLRQDTVQRNFSPSSVETSDLIPCDKESTLEVDLIEKQDAEPNNNSEREERRLLRFSSSSLKEPSFTGKIPSTTDNRRKSKSVVDLQSFLPDISANRKTVNSAPALNEDLMGNNNVVVTNIEVSPASPVKAMLPVAAEPTEPILKLESPKEGTSTRKLTKRFARTLSRKSVKATPRSVRDTTPMSSRPSSKPKEVLQLALAQLNNNEWEITIQGLQSLGKLARQHPDTIESQIHNVCVSLGRQIKNLRSQVARTACHTASEIFMSCKRGLDIELEEIAGPLLQRTADTNKFLRADANAALDVMCAHLPTNRVVTVVTGRGCTHQNCIVRSASIRLINDMVKRFGADKVFQMQKEMKDKILLAGANALTDGSLEARSYGKIILLAISCLRVTVR
ncbi:TOG array regulator of axonemal microtubules protein 2-like isoform X2 [Anoplophora glabripennis]|uniref:TOG array regulator of axonemal microtubules protein 2-like isoform X2 n=1 Tax=Anoplophora glabripennis TaxID=217634 RepID=UPI0008751D08|nr:TOG array regulator of axonemal microtubules protein 2-like isoform X2 [Anoplophora glabripennis]